MSAPEPTLHVWASVGAPSAPVARVQAHTCPECFALVVDRLAHRSWHEAVLIATEERISMALPPRTRDDTQGG